MKKQLTNYFDWLSTICLAILFLLASNRLMLTNWADDLDIIGWLVILGAGLGYFLGRWKIRWFVLVPVAALVSLALFGLLFILMMSQNAGLVSKALEVWNRISVAAAQLAGNQPVTDSILFVLGSGFLFWVIGVSTGITIMQSGNPWVPILLLGFALLLIEHYQPDPRRVFYTWSYSGICLILLGRQFFLKIHRDTIEANDNIGSDTEFDFSRGVVLSAVLVSALALITPGIVHSFISESGGQTRFSQQWETFTSNFENAFFALDQVQLTQEEQIAEDFSLGTGQISGKDPVLYIQINTPDASQIPFYWRGKVYSTYADKTWSLGNSYKQSYAALQTINSPESSQHGVDAKVWVQSLLPELSQVYTVGEVVNFNRRMDAAVATETIYEKEILGYFIEPAIKKNEIYRFETLVSTPTSAQLSEAGTNYPDWVLQIYLQLPEDLPQRVVELSVEITKDKPGAYDKAVAITQYLRANYEYQSIIPSPPRKSDPVDWFLFDYKKGFCNYFASAEVLLLRSAGVPARLAVGYAQGAPAAAGEGIVLQKEDSHAWPEVYFPGYGWIPFEPTAALPILDWNELPGNSGDGTGDLEINLENLADSQTSGLNGEDRANMLLEQQDAQLETKQPLVRRLSLFGKIIASLAGILAAGGLVYSGIRAAKNWAAVKESLRATRDGIRKRVFRIPLFGFWLQTLGLSEVQKNFSAIEFSLRILGEKTSKGSTPAELSSLLKTKLPEFEGEISLLLEQYQISMYSKHAVDSDAGKTVAKSIKRKAIHKWWELKRGRIRKTFDRFS